MHLGEDVRGMHCTTRQASWRVRVRVRLRARKSTRVGKGASAVCDVGV